MNNTSSVSFVLLVIVVAGLQACHSDPGFKLTVAEVDFNSLGCFHNSTYRLVLTKNGKITTATLENNNQIQIRILNDEQLRAFRKFIRQLKKLKEEEGCTTVDTYLVKYNTETIKKIDGGCEWRGFNKLREAIFTGSPTN